MSDTRLASLGPALRCVEGGARELVLADGRRIAVRAVLTDLWSLTPSHDPLTFQPDPAYPDGVQERRYHADDAARHDVDRIARKLEPRLVLEIGPRGLDGPPVGRLDGLVLGGNGRAMALQRCSRTYPPAWERYVSALRDGPWLGRAGIEPGRLEAFLPTPVLTLRLEARGSTLEDRRALADLASALNDVPTKARDVLGEATTRARRLREEDGLVDWFQEAFPSDETLRSWLRSAGGRGFFRRLVGAGVFLEQEAGRLMDAYGGLTDEAVQSIERMMYAAVVTDPEVVQRAPASHLNRLEHAVPAILKASTFEPWDVRPAVAEALDLLAGMRSTGASSVDEFLAQLDAFDRSFSDRAVGLARLLDEARKHEVRERFRRYGQLALEANERTAYVDLFEWEPPTPEDAFGALLDGQGDGEVPTAPPRAPMPEELAELPDELVDAVEAYVAAREQVARELEAVPDMEFGSKVGKKIWVSRKKNTARRLAERHGISDARWHQLVDAYEEAS